MMANLTTEASQDHLPFTRAVPTAASSLWEKFGSKQS